MAFKSYRDESRKDWGTFQTDSFNRDQINTGCLLRIADATEAMAKNHQALIDDRDRYKRWFEMERDDNYLTRRRLSAMRGVITKLKKRLAQGQGKGE